MQITGTNGARLNINVNSTTATFNVSVENGPIAQLSLSQVEQMLPSLSAAKAALEEATINKRKATLDTLRQQLIDIQAEITAIEAL